MKEKTITIEIVNGLLEIFNIPKDIKIIVRDYDIEGSDKTHLQKDDSGHYCVINEYCYKNSN